MKRAFLSAIILGTLATLPAQAQEYDILGRSLPPRARVSCIYADGIYTLATIIPKGENVIVMSMNRDGWDGKTRQAFIETMPKDDVSGLLEVKPDFSAKIPCPKFYTLKGD